MRNRRIETHRQKGGRALHRVRFVGLTQAAAAAARRTAGVAIAL